MILRLSIFCALAAIQFAPAQDRSPVEPAALPAPDQKLAPATSPVEKIDATRYRIGGVTIDRKSREIRFPAKVNMTDGLLEFVIVHQNGKVHESLLATAISPTHLNLAFTLLRYPASRELYPLPSETGGLSGEFPQVAPEVKAAARIHIEVEWNDGGTIRRAPVNDWIQHAVKTTAMPAGPWVYGGSEFHDGQYAPETSGDIAAIFLSLTSIINYPGEDNGDDTVWIPFSKRVPAEDTEVTVIISPHSKKPALPQP